MSEPPAPLRIGLVGCSGAKLTRPAPARELYTSSVFRWSLALSEHLYDRTFVLSGKLGLVRLDAVIEPYDCPLGRGQVARLAAWGVQVLEQLVAVLEETGEADREVLLIVFAGDTYASPFRHLPILEPLRYLSTGRRRNRLLTLLQTLGIPRPPRGIDPLTL